VRDLEPLGTIALPAIFGLLSISVAAACCRTCIWSEGLFGYFPTYCWQCLCGLSAYALRAVVAIWTMIWRGADTSRATGVTK